MFYLTLFVLILLGLIVLAVLGLNIGTLWTGIRLNLLVGHPNIPVLLLCILGAFLGALLLYVVSTFSARRDAQEIKALRARIEELEQSQVKAPSSSGSPGSGFAAPVVPIPGFASAGPMTQPSVPGPLPNFAPSGPLMPPPVPGPGPLPNLSPSSSGITNKPFPPRQGPPPMPQTGSGPRPPFFQP